MKIFNKRRKEMKNEVIEDISIDEMWTYVGARKGKKRKSVWIWTAVLEGKKMLFEVGDRSERTFLKLLENLPFSQRYHTDSYEVYNFLPFNRHNISKYGKVNWNEGRHSVLRDRLKRLSRKTKGYSKSKLMLKASLALVCLYLGWI